MSIYIYNDQELKKISEVCSITAKILDEIEDEIEVGVSTYDIDCFVKKQCKKYNVDAAFLGYQGFPSSVCTSVNEVVIHGIPNKKERLREGDIIGIDFGVFSEGFYGDSARTYKVGTVSEKVNNLLEVTKKSLYIAIDSAVVGNRIQDVSFAVQSYVEGFGFSCVRDFCGHGLGYNLHEEPSVPNYGKPGKGPRIQNGMVFAIEPMINAGTYKVKVLSDNWTVVTNDNSLSAHFEHTVAIIDGRAEILTKGKNFK